MPKNLASTHDWASAFVRIILVRGQTVALQLVTDVEPTGPNSRNSTISQKSGAVSSFLTGRDCLQNNRGRRICRHLYGYSCLFLDT